MTDLFTGLFLIALGIFVIVRRRESVDDMRGWRLFWSRFSLSYADDARELRRTVIGGAIAIAAGCLLLLVALVW